MLEMTLKNGDRYTLEDDGRVVARTNGPKGWNYSGKWIITGFKTRHNAHRMITLDEALAGVDTGQGWVCDLDHGTPRMWGSPSGRKLASIRRVEVTAGA